MPRSARGTQRSESRGASRVPRPWVVAAILLLLVGAIAVGVAAALLGRPGSEPGSTILEIGGRANDTSETFVVREGWSIEWENTGEYFSYTIHGDVEFGQVITQNGPGNGTTSPVPTGSFFIEVVAEGPWSIRVIQGG